MQAKQAPTSTQHPPNASRLEKTGSSAPRDGKTLNHYSCGVEAEQLEISVGITTFNNARFLVDAIREPLKNPVVTEVVISDDHSGIPDWHLITRSVESSVETVGGRISPWTPYQHPLGFYGAYCSAEAELGMQSTRFIVSRNLQNLGGFRNKYRAVQLASKPWVLLLDVDNYLLEGSIEGLAVLQPWNPSYCYAPSRLQIVEESDASGISKSAGPSREKTQLGPSKVFESRPLSRSFFAHMLNSRWSISRIEAAFFLNTGNFLVHRDGYLRVLADSFADDDFDPRAADAVAFSSPWLVDDNYFLVAPGFSYVHRVHSASYWVNNSGSNEARELEKSICESESSVSVATHLRWQDKVLLLYVTAWGAAQALPGRFRRARVRQARIFLALMVRARKLSQGMFRVGRS